MASARLKMLTLRKHITVSVMTQINNGVDANEIWMYGDWFYTTDYAIFGNEVKATERSPPDNLTRWIITQSRGFTKKGIEKISRSVRAYVYLILTSHVQARSSTVDNSAPAVDAQQLFKDTLKSLINVDLSIDIEKYQGVLEHALSKSRFFSRNRHIHASKQFEIKHWKKRRIQQQNSSKQHRHKNWFKQRYKQGS